MARDDFDAARFLQIAHAVDAAYGLSGAPHQARQNALLQVGLRIAGIRGKKGRAVVFQIHQNGLVARGVPGGEPDLDGAVAVEVEAVVLPALPESASPHPCQNPCGCRRASCTGPARRRNAVRRAAPRSARWENGPRRRHGPDRRCERITYLISAGSQPIFLMALAQNWSSVITGS